MMSDCWLIAEDLSQPSTKAAVQRALGQLAAAEGQQEALVTTEQLQYVCCKAVAERASTMLLDDPGLISEVSRGPPRRMPASSSQPGFSEQQTAALLAVRSLATTLMRQLQPTNPEAWAAAAQLDTAATGTAAADMFHLCGRALELGGRHGSLKPRAMAANHTLSLFAALYTHAPPPASAVATARLALAALDSMPAELERSRRLLPEMWVQLFGAAIQCASARAAAVRAILSGSRATTVPAVGDVGEAFARTLVACSGCGELPVGLRACARCRAVKYCR
jgi:hypothetical protein